MTLLSSLLFHIAYYLLMYEVQQIFVWSFLKQLIIPQWTFDKEILLLYIKRLGILKYCVDKISDWSGIWNISACNFEYLKDFLWFYFCRKKKNWNFTEINSCRFSKTAKASKISSQKILISSNLDLWEY